MARAAKPRQAHRAWWLRATTDEPELDPGLALLLLLVLVLIGGVLEVGGTKGEGPLVELEPAPVELVPFEVLDVALGIVAGDVMLRWVPEAAPVSLPGLGEGAAPAVAVVTAGGPVVVGFAAGWLPEPRQLVSLLGWMVNICE